MKLLGLSVCATAGMVAASSVQSPSNAAVRKCTDVAVRFPDAPEPVYVLNAQAVDPDSLPQLDPSEIESVAIKCTDYIYETFGIKAQRTGIVVFTTPGPRAALMVHMDSVVTLQEAFFVKHRHFASSLSDLHLTSNPGLISVKLTVAEDGGSWKATGTHRYLGGDKAPVIVGGSRSPGQ
jgi:hypothetical protein